MIIVCAVNRHCELVSGLEFIHEGRSNPYCKSLQKAITIIAIPHISGSAKGDDSICLRCLINPLLKCHCTLAPWQFNGTHQGKQILYRTFLLITAKAMGLIFSLFYVASAREVPFDIPQYVQCILHGLTNVLLCVPFIFADGIKCQFGGSFE